MQIAITSPHLGSYVSLPLTVRCHAPAIIVSAGDRAAYRFLEFFTARKAGRLRVTEYFRAVRARPDRAMIEDAWIARVMECPERTHVQADGRIRLWATIRENEGRYLRVILLPDRETVHNVFFDRGFRP